MSILTNPAFYVSITGLITAITALVKVINHKDDTDAHPIEPNEGPILPKGQ